LYYPESPYEFTADILGSVYERFLGKVITLTAGHPLVKHHFEKPAQGPQTIRVCICMVYRATCHF
jgi:hypothetical protein